MPTERESFLRGIRSYCARHGVSQYDAVLCEKSAEYGPIYAMDPEAFYRGYDRVIKCAQEYEDEEEAKENVYRKAKAKKKEEDQSLFSRLAKIRVNPWLAGGAALLGGVAAGTAWGRRAQRTGNPYGMFRGGLLDIGEFLTGKDLRLHPERYSAYNIPRPAPPSTPTPQSNPNMFGSRASNMYR